MKLATELNAMATKSIMNRENKKFNEALMFADNVLAGNLEEAAKHGKRSIWVKKPINIKWKYLRAYLEQNSFITIGIGNYCWIKW
mgnify:FL=1